MKLRNNLDKLVKTSEKVRPAPKKEYTTSQNPIESNPVPGSNSRK
jgi:hypothetical protein